jgi:uncharacterized lipoprotein NlpE involved in copper resistance
MKKIMITLLSMCFIITGCKNDEEIITSTQIKDLFEKHGVQLSEPTELHPENVFLRTLNDVAPETFTINESQLISIYVYSSSQEAEKGLKDFEDKTAVASVEQHSKFQIANVLLFYVQKGSFKDERFDLVIEDMKNP